MFTRNSKLPENFIKRSGRGFIGVQSVEGVASSMLPRGSDSIGNTRWTVTRFAGTPLDTPWHCVTVNNPELNCALSRADSWQTFRMKAKTKTPAPMRIAGRKMRNSSFMDAADPAIELCFA
jgi:hypothetical protein